MVGRIVLVVSVAYLLTACAAPSAPEPGSGSPALERARSETTADAGVRQSIIVACGKLTDAERSPFPLPMGQAPIVCGCAADRLENNGRIRKIAPAASEAKPRSDDSETSYFVAKVAAAALSCLGDDLDKIAENESQRAQAGMALWLSTLNASVLAVWPSDTESSRAPKILVPNQEEARRGKKGCLKPPQYPEIAARKDVAGTVTMAFLVDPDGRVRRALVVHSSGETPSHKVLDATALAYIGDCEFRPGTVDGVAVQSWAKVQYVWKLE